MADIPIQRLEIEHEVTCPICGALSERSTFDARLEMAELPPARRWWRARPDGVKECLRTHSPLGRRPAGGAL